MEGKYVLKVDASGAESAYTIAGKGDEHLKIIGIAMQAVMCTFWHIMEQFREEPVVPEEFIALSAMFTADVASRLVKEREGTADAKEFMDGLLKKANGEE